MPNSIRSQGFDDGLFFPLPEPLITGPATRVMSLRDGTKKMSKSDPSDNSRINLTDDADTIAQKIRKAKTDPEPLPSEEKGSRRGPRPTTSSASMRRWPARRKADVLASSAAGSSPPSRTRWSNSAWPSSSPIAAEMKRLVADPGHVDAMLVDGAERARAIAAETMNAAKDIVGFIRKR